MNRRLICSFLILLFTLSCSSEEPADKSTSSSVPSVFIKRVEDGDTVLAEVGEQAILVRLIGIDCPEIAGKHISQTQPYGPAAKKFLIRLVEKKWVKMKGSEHDKHGRILATLYLDGEDVNLKMVAVGLAEVYPGFSGIEYLEAENDAKANKLNLWQNSDRISPRDWRKQYKINSQSK